MAAKIIEQDALKKQVELLQLEKQNETQAMQQKYEQDMNAMHEQMVSMQESYKEILDLFKDPNLLEVLKRILTSEIGYKNRTQYLNKKLIQKLYDAIEKNKR